MNEAFVRRMAFTGEKISGAIAKQNGLVLEIFAEWAALQESAMAVAEKIATKAPSAIKASKVALNFNHGQSVQASLTNCVYLQVEHLDAQQVLSQVKLLTAQIKAAHK